MEKYGKGETATPLSCSQAVYGEDGFAEPKTSWHYRWPMSGSNWTCPDLAIEQRLKGLLKVLSGDTREWVDRRTGTYVRTEIDRELRDHLKGRKSYGDGASIVLKRSG